MLSRRGFLQLISTGTIGAATLDLDRLLWVPGRKTIFLPPATVTINDTFYVALHTAEPNGVLHEATYANYSRVAISRPRHGWIMDEGLFIKEETRIDFPQCTGDATTITHYDILDGNGQILARGALQPNIYMMVGASARLLLGPEST